MSFKIHTCLMCGGGTYGHIIPAHSIAKELLRQESNVKIIYAGAANSHEAKLAREVGWDFYSVSTAYLRRSLSLRNLVLPFILLMGLFQALGIISRQKPDIVIGTGGYSSLPLLVAARLKGIRYYLHEANAYPGLVIRMTAQGARRIYLGQKQAGRYLKASESNIVVTGNPVDVELPEISSEDARTKFNLDPNRLTLFVTGGSGGARRINQTIEKALPELMNRDLNLIWQYGKHYEGSTEYRKDFPNTLYMDRLLTREDMYLAFRAADLVIARAGAMTLAELALFGKPAILIPFPYSAEGHQEANAKAVEEANGGIMVLDKDFSIEVLLEKLKVLSNSDQLLLMSQAMKSLAGENAANMIVEDILRDLE